MKNNRGRENEIARWMYECLEKEESIYQESVVYEIAGKFGEEYTYINDNGNLAIDKKVLNEFKRLTEDIVVWERGGKYWRKRESHDELGKRQAD